MSDKPDTLMFWEGVPLVDLSRHEQLEALKEARYLQRQGHLDLDTVIKMRERIGR